MHFSYSIHFKNVVRPMLNLSNVIDMLNCICNSECRNKCTIEHIILLYPACSFHSIFSISLLFDRMAKIDCDAKLKFSSDNSLIVRRGCVTEQSVERDDDQCAYAFVVLWHRIAKNMFIDAAIVRH